MISLDDFPKRLNDILNDHDITASALAGMLQVQRSSISHLLSGRNKPSLEFIAKLMEVFPELSFDWLVYGKIPDENRVKRTTSHSPTLFDSLDTEPDIKTVVNKEKTLADHGLSHTDKPQSDKVLKRIILIYSDDTFETYIN